MRYEPKFNRIHAFEMYDWDNQYVIDRQGNIVNREDYYYDEIEMHTIRPESEN